MYEDFAPRLAKVLTEYSLPVKKGDYVVILSTTEAAPLIYALYEATLRLGAHPFVDARLPGLSEMFFRLASDEQLDFLDPMQMFMFEKIDVMFNIIAPQNTKALNNVDPARQARQQQASRPIIEKYFSRINDRSLRWNITAWPTPSSAQQAEMGLIAHTEFMYKAAGLDQPDPVAYWQAFRARQERLVEWLKGKSHVEVRGPGVNLSFEYNGRPWVSCHGTVNFPDGEIFTSPVEDTMNGTIEFNYPSVLYGREVNGVKLRFENGRAVEASASKNEEYLLSQIDMDEGARLLGEFAIGTNMGIQNFSGEILFDEKIGGTIHMALGEGIAESEGKNKSAIHWDMIHGMRDGGEIYVDGVLFYKSGQFMVES